MRHCPVGQITFICSSSQELSPRRKSVAGCLNRAAARFATYQPPDVGRIVRRRVRYLDTSGKSPAYHHHRKNFRARAGKPAAGFLNRTAAEFLEPVIPPMSARRLRTRQGELPSEPSKLA